MKLKVKKVNLSTGGPFIAILHEDTAKKLNIYPSDRLSVSRLRTKEKTNCVVNISSKGIKRNEIGLFDEVLQELDLDEKTNVEVTHSDRQFTIRDINKKLEGKQLSKEEI